MSERGRVEELPSVISLGLSLPGLFQGDERDPAGTGDNPRRPIFMQRFAMSFDEVLAPILSCLDNLDAYFDPSIAPQDFVGWLAGWVGVELRETWGPDQRRALVMRAVELYRWRGTVHGLTEMVKLFTGVEPEIVDNGGVSWSTAAETPLPGSAKASVVVRLRGKGAADLDQARLERLVAFAKPAHLIATVEVRAA